MPDPCADPSHGRSVRRYEWRPVEREPQNDKLNSVQQGPTGWDMDAVKAEVAASGLSTADLLTTVWSSRRTFRGSDLRGSANRAGIRLNLPEGPAGKRIEPVGLRICGAGLSACGTTYNLPEVMDGSVLEPPGCSRRSALTG
jgi:hypothetical protein